MQKGVLVFDPAVAGSAGSKLPPQGPPGTAGAGGGAITGAGAYYSKPAWMRENIELAETFVITGTLNGVLTFEVTNDDEEADLAGLAKWVSFTPATAPPAIAGAASFGRSDTVRYSGYRTLFTYSSGSGAIESRRILKRR